MSAGNAVGDPAGGGVQGDGGGPAALAPHTGQGPRGQAH